MATIAPVIPLDEHRAVRAPQPAPSEEASFLSLVYEMGKAEGERLAYEAMRRRQPRRPPSVEEYLTATGVAAILAASRPGGAS